MGDIAVERLTKDAFSNFGEVVEMEGFDFISTNQGFAERVEGLARIDVAPEGEVNVSLYAARLRPFPIEIRLMERHPLGSQLFLPLQNRPWLVLVCLDPLDASTFRAFEASGQQGVNYRRNVWHHPLLALGNGDRFVAVDRKGPGNNLQEVWLDGHSELSLRDR